MNKSGISGFKSKLAWAKQKCFSENWPVKSNKQIFLIVGWKRNDPFYEKNLK